MSQGFFIYGGMVMTLVLGGVRSGKTRFAVFLAKSRAEAVAYIATYDASAAGPDGDSEMEARIRQHRKDRPSHWLTVELGDRLVEEFERLDSRITCAVVDELSLAIASWVTKGLGDADITSHVAALVHLVKGVHDMFIRIETLKHHRRSNRCQTA